MEATWHDGAEAPRAGWSEAVASFLGGGFRVTVPLLPEALAFARDQARHTLDVLGIGWDEAPWTAIAPWTGAVEISGGASYDAQRRAFGPPWTHARSVPLPATTAAEAGAVDLPWAWSSDSALAGLPLISALEEAAAARHLKRGTVGLWWNHRDELCTSTAGPLLLRAEDGWVHPDERAAAVPSWAWAAEAAARGSRPVRVDRDLLGRAREVLAVSPLGVRASLVPG